jgi:hypothetical protein
MLTELIKSVLTLVIAFFLKLLFVAIGVEIDPIIFNTIVAGIVLWLLTQLGYGLTARAVRGTRAESLLPEDK